MAKKVRVYELAKELGLSNKDALDLCISLGIGVKSHSSSVEDAQADRVRRKADREGMKGASAQPPDEEARDSTPKRQAIQTESSPSRLGTRKSVVTSSTEESLKSVGNSKSGVEAPPPSLVTETRPDLAKLIVEESARLSAEEHRSDISKEGDALSFLEPEPGTRGSSSRPVPRPSTPQIQSYPKKPQLDAGTFSGQRGIKPPVSSTGKPIPPPPGPPRSATGKPIPPPPRPISSAPMGHGNRPDNRGATGQTHFREQGRSTGFAGSPRPQGDRPPVQNRGPSTSGAPNRFQPSNRTNSGPTPSSSGGVSNQRGPGPGPGSGAGPQGFRGGAARPEGSFSPDARRSAPSGGFSAPRGGSPRVGGGPPSPPPAAPSGRGGRGTRPQQRPAKRRSKKVFEELEPTQITSYSPSTAPVPDFEVIIERGSTAQEVGPRLNRSAGDVVRFLLLQGELVTATQSLSDDMVELFAAEIGAKVRLVDAGQEQEAVLAAKYFDEDESEDPAQMLERSPVITVMGHVDHGKTKLLDRIRTANVVAQEAGGITQHIGAYQAFANQKAITFIDTPGHEAFTAMRARGAKVTDIVVLVVAADDGVMPQTVEAINHAKAAEVPIVVAINKVDRADADPTRVMQQLSDHGLVPEQWGGDSIMVEVSALQNLGIDELLDHILVLAEIQELKANKTGRASGTVLEGNLDVGRGPVATILVQKGTLKIGDPMVAGQAWGRVKALVNDRGTLIKSAGPSTPVQVLGFSEVPSAGDEFHVTADLATSKTIGETREQRIRMAGYAARTAATAGAKLEDLFEQIQKGEVATLNLIVKADVQGSLEAVSESLRKLERPEVRLSIVHKAVGAITENDVGLAAASNATIIGFNVRPDRRAREMSESLDVEIRTYEIIYKVLEDIESAMVGMLAPEYEEVVTGEAEVREIFRVPKLGAIAGCYVRSGVITRASKVRFLRDGVVIWNGTVTSLRRFKDDVREVQTGFECGIGLSDFQDLHAGDLIETFMEREIPRQ